MSFLMPLEQISVLHAHLALRQATENLPPLLIIENNALIRDVLLQTVQLAGYQALAIPGGEEGLNWVYQTAHAGYCPRLVIIDLSMKPDKGGAFLTLLSHYWKASKQPHPHVIALTTLSLYAYSDFSCVQRFISKPFHVREILKEVRQILPLQAL